MVPWYHCWSDEVWHAFRLVEPGQVQRLDFTPAIVRLKSSYVKWLHLVVTLLLEQNAILVANVDLLDGFTT